MAEPTAEWGKQLSRQVDILDADVAVLKTDVAALRQEFRDFRAQALTVLSVVKWVGGMLSGSMLLAGLAGIYSAGQLKATVEGQSQRITEWRAEVNGRLDRIEARLDRLIPPAAKADRPGAMKR